MTGRLTGKVVIISGGGGAIGSAQAKLFASEGARVCVADINIHAAETVAREIRAAGGEVISATLDVRKADEWDSVVALSKKQFGIVNILCNIAGSNFRVSFDEQTIEQWRNIIDVGLTGSFLGIKAVVPAMRRAGSGVILNMGSLYAIRPTEGMPGYAAQKTGMIGLTRSAALSYAKDNIRCVLISPGHVDTPFLRDNASHSPNDWSTSINNPENYKNRLSKTPLGRLLTGDDIANTFLFAASDEAAMITGSMITVDGGASL
jgi:NAD(P)-dependent dehydrogenase (short-subunit alcohol dehydrogenase family)